MFEPSKDFGCDSLYCYLTHFYEWRNIFYLLFVHVKGLKCPFSHYLLVGMFFLSNFSTKWHENGPTYSRPCVTEEENDAHLICFRNKPSRTKVKC